MGRPYPRLIHPVRVTIEQTNPTSTVWDNDAREAVQQVARKAAVTLQGQASYGSSKDMSPGATGIREGEDGYVLFRQSDLAARSISLQVNDRITQIGGTLHDAYITRLQPMGHYPEFGSTIVRAYFSDRQPAKHRRRAS